MRNLLYGAIACSLLFLSGCEYLRVLNFDKDDNSGVEEQKYVSLYILNDKIGQSSQSQGSDETGISLASEESDYGDTFSAAWDDCAGQTKTAAGLLTALVGFAIDQGLAFVTNEMASEAGRLRERGQRKYSASVTLRGKEALSNLKDGCLLLVRSDQESKKSEIPPAKSVGLLLVLRIEEVSDNTFRLKTRYFRATNAQAITGKGKEVDFEVGFAARAVTNADGKPAIKDYATDTLSIKKVKLGEERQNEPAGRIQLDHPDSAELVEITISIVESGSTVPDPDKIKAELKALREAVGPELKKLISGE